ncbi:hypothetical protein LOK74_16900 [Brevibacillus humidisoli]|uniref:CBO0543 family protein n=1 Tax=Brevibacillus humidisoli TaxID=2895522 RepID=UPI001E5780BF|nr:CBO0543 family protein [Brevibacillus humidisoli]UFJ39721.1 hypothetical protein LOK74_16900 [Brevibacillus humidisoli]
MHFLIAGWIVFAAWKWGDWADWRRYHATMLYIALGNLMYHMLTKDHWLWKLQPDLLPTHVITEVIYTLIIFPLSAFLFLSNDPPDRKGKILHTVKWIIIYVGLEFIGMLTGRVLYQLGWNLFWSAVFNCIMFPMLRLHYHNPVLAYPLSFVIAVALLILFDIPLQTAS